MLRVSLRGTIGVAWGSGAVGALPPQGDKIFSEQFSWEGVNLVTCLGDIKMEVEGSRR